MNSPLSVAAYKRLLVLSPSARLDREEAADAVDAVLHEVDRFDALKAAVRRRRKRSIATAALSPLIESPQHSSRSLHAQEETDDDANDEATARTDPERSPLRLAAPAMATLPPLTVRVLERKKLFLNATGEPVVGVEELLQLQERTSPRPSRVRASPLQLTAVPRKVFEDDEVALMPCHSLQFRCAPSLDVEKWKEPQRDRDKHWRDDELRAILATHGTAKSLLQETKMTRGPGATRKGTWRKLDSQRLQIKSSDGSSRSALLADAFPASGAATAATVASPRDASLPGEVLLRCQGAMISRTYCIVTIYGVGIYGRLYSEGLADRQGATRFLRIDTYDPRTSRVASLRVSLADLEWVFEAHPELLAAGKKQTVLTKVVSLLFFQYPEEQGEEATASGERATSREAAAAASSLVPACDDQSPASETAASPPVPVLCISPDEKLNEAARRRLEREERLRREEQERLRLLALLLQQPRRARHRVAFALRRVSGFHLLVSVYHLPSQVRNLLVVAYHAATSRSLSVAVGVAEAAALSGVRALPHTWTREQKTLVAEALLPALHLRGAKTQALHASTEDDDAYRVALAIREDRLGPQAAPLPLPVSSLAASRKDAAVAKYMKDGRHERQLALETRLAQLTAETVAKTDALRSEIGHAEATLAALKARDAQLQEQIEEINSGRGMAAAVPLAVLADDGGRRAAEKQQSHELRRGHKAARKTIKDESKALQARVVAWKRELELAREHDVVESERAQAAFDKAVETLAGEAATATLALWFDPRDRTPPARASERGGNRQRTRLHRGEIRDGCVALAGGACVLGGRRWRFTVFAEVATSPPLSVETEEEEDEQRGDAAAEWFQLCLYDAQTSERPELRLARLEWIALTKAQHAAQLLLPALAIATSPAVQQSRALDDAYEATRRARAALAKLRKHEKKRRQLTEELRRNRAERRALWRGQAPWAKLMQALCARLGIGDEGEETGTLVLDRCLYRATLGIVSLASVEEETEAVSSMTRGSKIATSSSAEEEEDGVVDCEVWATQRVASVVFHARDAATGEVWSLEYPDSAELAKEVAVETELELQLHLEAIAMTLLLYTEEETEQEEGSGKRRRRRKMRFEG